MGPFLTHQEFWIMIGLMKKRVEIRIILLWFIFFGLISSCNRPQTSGFDLTDIDTSGDPVQRLTASYEPILIETKSGRFTLTPVAEYQLAGKVVSKEFYTDGWEAELSPLDLAIVWGKLAPPEFEGFVSFRQRNRWYFYQYPPHSPLDHNYILSHSANNHIIPASENIARALRSIGKKEKILLEGFLVNVQGTYRGGTVFWNTSTTRKDTGNGSCELIYVTRVQIGSDIYE